MKILQQNIGDFRAYLIIEEKAKATIQKYIRDVQRFRNYLAEKELSKEVVVAYKQYLLDEGYFSNDERGVLYNKDKTMIIQMSYAYEGEFTVPNSVTTIGESAFWWCEKLTTIILPENLTTIQSAAFCNCTGLTSIDLPSGLREIGTQAFMGCANISEIILPASVESIGGGYVFDGMRKLERIIVEEGNEFFSSDEYGVLFDKEKTFLIAIPSQLDEVYAVPEGVEKIGNHALANGKISGVIIPASVEIMESSSFVNCHNLTEITFLGDAPKMATYTFSGIEATCYYPADNATWTTDVMQNYGGTLTWVEQTPEVDYIPGDVNGDGRINPTDLVQLAQYISDGCTTVPDGYNVVINELAADVDADGKIRPGDLVLISQYISDGCITDPDEYNVVLLPSTRK